MIFLRTFVLKLSSLLYQLHLGKPVFIFQRSANTEAVLPVMVQKRKHLMPNNKKEA